MPGFTTEDLDVELYDRRTLWRMHCMRSTLFVVPSSDVPAFQAGAGRQIAGREWDRLRNWLEADMDPEEAARWMDRMAEAVVDVLGERELATRALAHELPELNRQVTVGSGKWAARVPVSSRLLYLMAMQGRIVRTRTAGSWKASQYRWAVAEHWRGSPAERLTTEEGQAVLAERYLATHGPVTLADLRWWTGWTAAVARRALEEVRAEAVELEEGRGWVLPGDVEPEQQPAGPAVALLPGLDSTPMGYKDRAWYLPVDPSPLFDGNGNVGPTVWVDGRAVGAWAQRPGGELGYELVERVSAEGRARIDEEAAALTRWLDGVVVSPRFSTPLVKRIMQRPARTW